jgi:hypothetical protein
MSIELCKFYHSIAWKSYRGVQAQERLYREKFQQKRAKDYAASGNGDMASALKQIKQRERLKGDYASIRRGYGTSKQGLSTLDTPDPLTGGRKLITNSTEIHDYLLRQNENHYSQAIFSPPLVMPVQALTISIQKTLNRMRISMRCSTAYLSRGNLPLHKSENSCKNYSAW